MTKNVTQKSLQRLLGGFGLVATGLLVVGAVLAWQGHNFATTQVRKQLTQEKIFFPVAGSAELDPKTYPGLQKYAGQQVDNGPKAKAYADEFIWVHMMKASSNRTYAEISEEARKNPQDQKLAGLKNMLFQGNMLRTSLLTAYAFSVFGTVAWYGLWACMVAALLTLTLSLACFAHARRS